MVHSELATVSISGTGIHGVMEFPKLKPTPSPIFLFAFHKTGCKWQLKHGSVKTQREMLVLFLQMKYKQLISFPLYVTPTTTPDLECRTKGKIISYLKQTSKLIFSSFQQNIITCQYFQNGI